MSLLKVHVPYPEPLIEMFVTRSARHDGQSGVKDTCKESEENMQRKYPNPSLQSYTITSILCLIQIYECNIHMNASGINREIWWS